MRKWVAIGPAPLLEMLAPLADEHRRLGNAELVEVSSGGLARYVQSVSAPGTTVVIAESPFQPSVRGRFTSPFVRSSSGSSVFVSWLRLDEERLGTYANRAATLLNRPMDQQRTVVLLASREQRGDKTLLVLSTVSENQLGQLTAEGWWTQLIRGGLPA